jgi:hypothetical protein
MHSRILFGTGLWKDKTPVDLKKRSAEVHNTNLGEKRKLNTKVIRIKRQRNMKLNNQLMNDKME